MNSPIIRESGNTLLELLVAMSAGLIVLGGAMLSIKFLRSETEKQSAEQIVTFLEQSSLNAVRSQTTVEVMLKDNLMIESKKGRSISLPSDYEYTVKFGGNKGAVVFYPSGFSSAGTIAINGSRNFCVISQTISGARKLECSNVS